jgi:hypothetical protein
MFSILVPLDLFTLWKYTCPDINNMLFSIIVIFVFEPELSGRGAAEA